MGEDRTERRATNGAPRTIDLVQARVTAGPDAGRAAEGRAVTVGSSTDNDLALSDPTVSRYHLELTAGPTGVRVRDLGSLNGSFVGSIRVREITVPPGTSVQVGACVIELADARRNEDEDGAPTIEGLVAASEPMREVARTIAQLAKSDVAVLLQGETGTGKEVVARALHATGPRRDAPFVVVDCGSMPAGLVASELFGHERGAFTNAVARHVGAFERAHGGTLLLDEIGELPLAVQPVLLGALERRRFRRVGGREEVAVDVRIVSATHRDLRAGVNEERFRADLYYRLAVTRLVLPPLRERLDDLDALIRRFVGEVTGSPDNPFSEPVMAELRRHPFSGNVRELRNIVEGALAMGRVDLEPRAPRSPAGGARTYKDARAAALGAFERAYLSELMAACDGNASEAARRAKMDRGYLLSLLRRNGLR